MKSLKGMLIAIILGVSAIICVVSCGASEKDREEAQQTLTEALDSLKKFDLVSFGEYSTDGEALKVSGIKNVNDFIDYVFDNSGMKEQYYYVFGKDGAESLAEGMKTFFNKVLADRINCEIVRCVNIDTDEAVFEVKLSYPDFANFDMSGIMNEEVVMNLGLQLMKDGVINSKMSNEEITQAAMPYIVDYLIESADDWSDSIETVTDVSNVVLIKKNGKWLINDNVDFSLTDIMGSISI